MNKPSKYTIGHLITVKGLQAQVLSVSKEYPNGFGGEYRMIGVQYLTGIRSAIYEECEPTDAYIEDEAEAPDLAGWHSCGVFPWTADSIIEASADAAMDAQADDWNARMTGQAS